MATDADMPSPWWSERIMRREYVERGRTKAELADRWGCSRETIDRWLEKHGIPE